MKKTVLVLLAVIAFVSLNSGAQVMWNLKGGAMPRHVKGDQTRLDWMAGLEIEVPLSSKFNIETGPRFRHHMTVLSSEDSYKYTYLDYNENQIEMPIRLAYKQPLGKRFSMHIGVGPYANYALLGDYSFEHKLYAGVESSIAFNWKCLSLGATYHLPIYKGYDDMNKPGVMATLGIRFKSSAWKYVGVGALAVATVGVGVLLAADALKGNDDSGNYSSTDYGSSSDSYGTRDNSSSSNSSSSNHSVSEVTAKNRDEKTYSNYEGQLSKMNTYWETQYNDSHRKEIQQKMRNIRTKWEKRGYNMYHSEWESWDGRKR